MIIVGLGYKNRLNRLNYILRKNVAFHNSYVPGLSTGTHPQSDHPQYNNPTCRSGLHYAESEQQQRMDQITKGTTNSPFEEDLWKVKIIIDRKEQDAQ